MGVDQQRVIDVVRQNLKLPDHVTDDEIADDFSGTATWAFVAAELALRDFSRAWLGVMPATVRDDLSQYRRNAPP